VILTAVRELTACSLALAAVAASIPFVHTDPAMAGAVEVVPAVCHPRGGGCAYQARVRGAAGEINAITLTGTVSEVVVSDAGAPLQVGQGCERIDAHTARCLVDDWTAVDAGDGDDEVRNRIAVRAQTRAITVDGGAGDDRLIGAAGEDYLSGGAGDDVLEGGEGGDVLEGDARGSPAGDDGVDGGPGSDRVLYDTRRDVRVDLAASGPDGRAGERDDLRGIESVTAGGGDDLLRGDGGGNALDGGPGDDVVTGLGGDDDLRGGRGVDRIRGGDGDDTLNGAADGWYPIGGEAGRGRIACGAGFDKVEEHPADDRITTDCERVHLFNTFALFAPATTRIALGSPVATFICRRYDCLDHLYVRTARRPHLLIGRRRVALREGERATLRLNALGRRLLASRRRLDVLVGVTGRFADERGAYRTVLRRRR
jgi:hemolysin type calcium-binding protein